MGVAKVLIGKLAGGTDTLSFYPVGAIYQSFDPTNPSELFGGEWEQITGRFLRAANDTNTGGSDTVTLTINQIPSHNHNGQVINVGWNAGGNGDALCLSTYSQKGDILTANTGGGQAHNNMPAYQDVYTWKRVA